MRCWTICDSARRGCRSSRSHCLGWMSESHRRRPLVLPITSPYHPNDAPLPEHRLHVHAYAGVDLWWDPDVGHGELADDQSCGGSEEPGLGQGEREGGIGPDARIVWPPRPGVET